MAQKTFGQAFAEARKQGLDKFEWKGGWYTTKRADGRHKNGGKLIPRKI